MPINDMHMAKAERLIAAGRLGVAAFVLLIFYVELPAASYNTAIVHLVVTGYVVFALLMLALTWLNCRHPQWLKSLSQFLDFSAAGGLIFITENAVPLLIVYFIFALFCIALRWRRACSIWIALGVLPVFLGLYLAVELYAKDTAPETGQIIIRSAFLMIISILLIFLGAFKQQLQRDLQRLSAWSHPAPDMQDLETYLQALLQHTAEVFRAPRILILWFEADSLNRHLAILEDGHFQLQDITPSLFRSLIDKPFRLNGFLCLNASGAKPRAILNTPLGLRHNDGLPLHNALIRRFEIKQVLAAFLNGEKCFNGWLFFLDRQDMSVDDLYFADIVAKRVTADMERFYGQRRLNNQLIAEERSRIARDLHDNMLQFLPGIAMHLEAIQQLLPPDIGTAKAQLQETQALIADKQRELRSTVKQVRAGIYASPDTHLACHTYLESVGQILTHQWGIKVNFTGEPLLVRMSSERAQEIRYLIHEAMINSARHSKGKEVHAAIHHRGNDLQISVRDNGLGFPFKGRFSLDELNAKNMGPKTLKERVRALGGWLVIDSSAKGSHLWIFLPVPQN